MSRETRRRFLQTLPEQLVQIPREEWPEQPPHHHAPLEVWRSRRYVALVYDVPGHPGMERISVRSTETRDGLTWDELQGVKAAIGRGHLSAVELYPPDSQVVAVARMRHLWVVPTPSWAWGGR